MGIRTLQFGDGVRTAVTSNTVNITAGVAAALLITTQPATSALAGSPLAPQPVVQLVDAGANAVLQAGVTVTASIASGGGTLGGVATMVTNASGVATFTNLSIGGLVGPRTLLFASGTLTSTTSGSIAVTTGATGNLVMNGGNLQTAVVGTAVGIAPSVMIADNFGNPIAGIAVTFTVAAPGAVVSNGVNSGASVIVTTNAAGIAALTSWTLGATVGSYSLTAAAVANSSPQTFTATATAGPASQVTLTVQPSAAAQGGVAFPTQPVVQLRDAGGNVVLLPSVTITATIASGSGTLSGTATAITNASGVATFTNLAIVGSPGARTLQFGSVGLTPATSATITVGAVPPSFLFPNAGDLQSAPAGTAVAVAPSVMVLGAIEEPLPGVTVVFAVASGGGSATGLSAVTNALGIATVGSWTLGTAPGPNTLTATAGALSATFTATGAIVAASVVKDAAVVADNQFVLPGANFVVLPKVRVLNAASNPVSGQTVTFTSTSGTVTSSVVTDVNGYAQVSSWIAPASARPDTVRANIGAIVSAPFVSYAANPFTLLLASQSAIVQELGSNAVPLSFTVQVADSANNPIRVLNLNVNLGSGPEEYTIDGVGDGYPTNASGLATMSGIRMRDAAGAIHRVYFDATFGTTQLNGLSNQVTLQRGPAAELRTLGTRFSADQVGTATPSIAPKFFVSDGVGVPKTPVLINVQVFGRCQISVGETLQTSTSMMSDSNGEVTPSIRLPGGGVGAGCTVFAAGTFPTVTQASDSSYLAVYPSGTTAVWRGFTDDVWNRGDNWFRPGSPPPASPTSADQIFVPQYAPASRKPRITAVAAVARAVLDTGALVNLGGIGLDIGAGGVRGYGTFINGAVRLLQTATADGVFDQLDAGTAASCDGPTPVATLDVVVATSLNVYCRAVIDTNGVTAGSATVRSGGSLQINTRGTLIVNGNATFGGDSVSVLGSMYVVDGVTEFGGGRVGIYNANNVSLNDVVFKSAAGSFSNSFILVRGNAVFGGAGAGQQSFSGGTLAIYKNFTQLTGTVAGVTGLTFSTSGDHVTAFAGTTSQSVSFANPTTSKFSRVRITNPLFPVVFNSNVEFINGTTQPRLEVQAGGLTIPNPQVLNLGGGQWALSSGTTTTVDGFILSAGSCTGRNIGATLTGTGQINGGTVALFGCPIPPQ